MTHQFHVFTLVGGGKVAINKSKVVQVYDRKLTDEAGRNNRYTEIILAGNELEGEIIADNFDIVVSRLNTEILDYGRKLLAESIEKLSHTGDALALAIGNLGDAIDVAVTDEADALSEVDMGE